MRTMSTHDHDIILFDIEISACILLAQARAGESRTGASKSERK